MSSSDLFAAVWFNSHPAWIHMPSTYHHVLCCMVCLFFMHFSFAFGCTTCVCILGGQEDGGTGGWTGTGSGQHVPSLLQYCCVALPTYHHLSLSTSMHWHSSLLPSVKHIINSLSCCCVWHSGMTLFYYYLLHVPFSLFSVCFCFRHDSFCARHIPLCIFVPCTPLCCWFPTNHVVPAATAASGSASCTMRARAWLAFPTPTLLVVLFLDDWTDG